MEPDLMDIGSHLGDTIHYQTVHEELISKLKVKHLFILLHFLLDLCGNPPRSRRNKIRLLNY